MVLSAKDFAAYRINWLPKLGNIKDIANELGVDIDSVCFVDDNPLERAEAIVVATTNFNNPSTLVEVSKNLGEAMVGINIDDLDESEKLAKRGW